MLETNRKAQ